MILSDIDGFYNGNPESPDSKLIPVIETIDDKVRACAGGAGSRRGTGGMQTKLNAAELVAEDGIDMVLSNGNAPELLYDIIKGKAVGTLLLGKKGL